MIKRCTIEDIEDVNRIMRHPEIYPQSIDDGCPPNAIDFDAGPILASEAMYFLAWRINGIWGGLWMFKPWNSITYEIHTCVLPTFRGRPAIREGKAAGAWMFENTPCQKVVTLVPENNRPALAYALATGLEKEGLVRQSFLKDGQLLDQTLLGIEKGGWLCQQ